MRDPAALLDLPLEQRPSRELILREASRPFAARAANGPTTPTAMSPDGFTQTNRRQDPARRRTIERGPGKRRDRPPAAASGRASGAPAASTAQRGGEQHLAV